MQGLKLVIRFRKSCPMLRRWGWLVLASNSTLNGAIRRLNAIFPNLYRRTVHINHIKKPTNLSDTDCEETVFSLTMIGTKGIAQSESSPSMQPPTYTSAALFGICKCTMSSIDEDWWISLTCRYCEHHEHSGHCLKAIRQYQGNISTSSSWSWCCSRHANHVTCHGWSDGILTAGGQIFEDKQRVHVVMFISIATLFQTLWVHESST